MVRRLIYHFQELDLPGWLYVCSQHFICFFVVNLTTFPIPHLLQHQVEELLVNNELKFIQKVTMALLAV
jgi:hypothetical protein